MKHLKMMPAFTNNLSTIDTVGLPIMIVILQVQISKKGVYAPGTRNRLVTIKGTQVQ